MSEIDENFICGRDNCGGELVFSGEKINGLKVFVCIKCGSGPQIECPVCHKPRTLWAKRFKLCFMCSIAGKNNI